MAGVLGPETVDAAAKLLAGEHVADDPLIQEIYRAPHVSEVRLIEITTSVTADGEVFPYRFTEDPPDVPFKSLVVLLHPDDWSRKEKLEWPPELALDSLERIYP